MKTALDWVGALLAVVIAVAALASFPLTQGSHPSRSVAQIQMLAAACEAYRTDHGHYPSDPATTEQLRPNMSFDSAAYQSSSAYLYRCLFGKSSNAPTEADRVDYMPDFDKSWLRTTPTGITYIVDVWGNSIGYSTFKSVHPESADGYNETFDLWSTGGRKSKADTDKWIKNW
jgi:hypothetical protein